MINWSCLSLGLPGNCEKQELLVFTVFTWFFQVFDSNYRGSFDPKNPFRDHIPDELPIPQMVKHLPGPQTCGHFLWKTMVSFRGCEKYQGDGSFFTTLGYFFTTLWSIWKHIEGSCWDETCHCHQVYSWMVLLRVSHRQSDWGYSRYNCGIFCGEKCHFLSRLRLSRLNMDKPW